MLGDLGADVVVVEPPGGHASRGYGPFADDVEGPERSLWWWYYNTSKRSVVVDLTTDDGVARLRRLIAALTPPDRSVILLWLEGLDARAIAEVTGLSPNNVAVKTHRIRALLAREFEDGDPK
jgi:DNA-directed RNA polymerase specialized sigma24 family protein